MSVAEGRGTVLVVDDDPAVGKVLVALLTQAAIACEHVLDADRAVAFLRERPVDVVITDLRMPGRTGVELLEDVVGQWPETRVVLLTAHPTVELAVKCMQKGAADFLCKPFEREEILFTIRKQIAAARHDERPPVAELKGRGVASTAPSMRQVEDMIRRASAGTFTVLIRGENGTGKDVVARAIHNGGTQHDGPFVRVQCAAFPDALIESELFGYEKGAFSGAATRRPGRVDAAQGGTLFLDEIGDVPLPTQIKLLKLLQEREYERLGSNHTLTSTARFISATHQPLEELIRKGTFREDLFFRLNVLPLWIPPLRQRPEDIRSLALHFCRAATASNARSPMSMSPQALELLRLQPWPGNVRQLQNFVERLVIMSDSDRLTAADVERELARQPILSLFTDPRTIDGRHDSAKKTPLKSTRLTRPTDTPGSGPETSQREYRDIDSLEVHRRKAEREAVSSALAHAKGNKVKAAASLGISRRTLYNKLAEYSLFASDEGDHN